MADHKAAATNFLNALEGIPKMIEQNKTQNASIEKDLPTLREVVGSVWKKEDELKELKSELSAIERKIQLELKTPEQTTQTTETVVKHKSETTASVTPAERDNNQFLKDHVIIARLPPPAETHKGFKI